MDNSQNVSFETREICTGLSSELAAKALSTRFINTRLR